MQYLYKQFQAKKKEVIEVEMDRPTKVRFMTATEFKRYKNCRTFTFYGGTFDSTPVRFVVPHDAVWYVVVEKGLRAEAIPVKAQCRVLPPDRQIRSSVALDAPAHVRAADALMEAGVPGADSTSE
ncbi:MAG: DUF1883 domain-containing protein [Flavobacteriales bacterium]|nr:hypothetical protein [Flavobacteriales bacterium]MCC6576490.1 DUF1883 domain-containing protein [Flavobacteriales bacterium]NUQ16522.1 DUF1883 domain-containing protein [Flavobacteriales bacterium]